MSIDGNVVPLLLNSNDTFWHIASWFRDCRVVININPLRVQGGGVAKMSPVPFKKIF